MKYIKALIPKAYLRACIAIVFALLTASAGASEKNRLIVLTDTGGNPPSFLNLINNGLSDPEHPHWGGP